MEGIAKSLEHLPQAPKKWYITGGGRKNSTMMQGLADKLEVPVVPVEEAGWNGDSMEAEGFAYLAVRSLAGLPLTFPTTTGVKEPLTGGVFYKLMDLGASRAAK